MNTVVEMPTQAIAKRTRRAVAKPARTNDAEKTRLGLRLGVDAYRRLSVHALMVGQDMSDVVEALINEHLKRYVISDRAKPATEATPIESAA